MRNDLRNSVLFGIMFYVMKDEYVFDFQTNSSLMHCLDCAMVDNICVHWGHIFGSWIQGRRR